MGDGRRAGVIVVVVIAVRVYNDDFSFSDFFVTIRTKKAYQQARGHNAPKPIIVVIMAAAATGSVAVTASSNPQWAVLAGLLQG